MRDITLGVTCYCMFTTRAFSTGVPTTLSGSPVVSMYEDNNTTQITAGVSLTVDHDSVTGLNLVEVVATGGNGFENGKEYHGVITTGTVGGVSVIGEIVFQLSIGQSAAAVDLANGTDGLTALKTTVDNINSNTISILADTGSDIPASITVIDGIVDSILLDTAEIGTAGAGLTDLGGMSTGMQAEVNAEVDTALATTTYGEPAQGTPGATISLVDKINFLYKAWRNKSTQVAATYSLFNDDTTTVDHKAPVSDDGTTATKGEVVTGP